MLSSRKYARSLHAPISRGTTSDDRFLPPGYLRHFAEMDKLILTEKLDGQNNCLNRHGVFARSHVSPSAHPWDRPLWNRWQLIKEQLGTLEIFGENMYAIHSIAYHHLASYFYVFAVREGDRWLSWEEVTFYAALLDFPTVPVIEVKEPLRKYWSSEADPDRALSAWFTANLGCSWLESTTTGGRLGGYDPTTGRPASEGFVIRNAGAFLTNNGDLPVAENEFDHLFKVVRPGHVKTDVHWTKNWQPATLADYYRHGWQEHAYLSQS